ncbi:MAG: CpsD/CapB family tyrosine-protein kinase [Ruminococcaceae bacterium]|nr:CpsD/CapB family tyrosine-protein kinase [Oscillospiraceae bacterium]
MEAVKLRLPGDNDFFTEEAYKVLRTNLQFCGQDVKVIAITSCNENDGKTTVALHIAKSFAELDKRVLLIDADMRKSVMAGRNTSAQSHSGLSEVLTGMCPITECLYPVVNSKMHILFAGQYPPNPVELLNGKYFAALINECRKVYDYIIIDTPPLGQVIDAAVVAEKCDGAVMVLGNSKVHYRMAQEVIEQIKKSGCKMLGVVRNNRKQSNRKYYYRKYYHHDSKSKKK